MKLYNDSINLSFFFEEILTTSLRFFDLLNCDKNNKDNKEKDVETIKEYP